MKIFQCYLEDNFNKMENITIEYHTGAILYLKSTTFCKLFYSRPNYKFLKIWKLLFVKNWACFGDFLSNM